jgi:two-component system, LuxR family, response regulator FixJ
MQEEEYSDSLVIVDDDPHVLSALRFAFEIEGYDVQTYTTGEEVLNAPPLSAACIVIDENLPGVSGVQTASLLRSHGLEIPIIIITTCPSRELRQRADEARAEIVEKPLVTDALARRVKHAMGSTLAPLKSR